MFMVWQAAVLPLHGYMSQTEMNFAHSAELLETSFCALEICNV